MSQDNARSGRMAECSSFRTRELNMIWKNLSELASIPTRGSRLVGGWSSATVMTSGSADVRCSQPVREKKSHERHKKHKKVQAYVCAFCAFCGSISPSDIHAIIPLRRGIRFPEWTCAASRFDA